MLTLVYGFSHVKNEDLLGFMDSDWVGFVDDMKSTNGYVFSLGSGVFSWNSKKQFVVTQSTTEAKFIAASSGVNQVIWLREILKDLGQRQQQVTAINCDNKTTISMVKNLVNHGRTKHIYEDQVISLEMVKRRKKSHLFTALPYKLQCC